MKKVVTLIALACCIKTVVFSQNISINTDGSNADNSAMLDIKSTSKGLLIPRMTTAQRTAIASPAKGLMVFDTDLNAFWFYNGSAWVNFSLPGAATGWSLTGNSGTNTASNFIGTVDKTNFQLKAFNFNNLTLDTLGNVLIPYYKLGIGTLTPHSLLEVNGTDPNTAYAPFRVVNSGDNNRAVDLFNTSASTVQPALLAYVVGNNNAGAFLQANNNSDKPALYATTSGRGGAGYFTSSASSGSGYSILKSEFTGSGSSITAIEGISNSSSGVGGYFNGTYRGINAKGSIGGSFSGNFKGAEVSLLTTSNNGGFYDYGLDVQVDNAANADYIIGINSKVQGRNATGNVIGVYSEVSGTGPFVTTFFGVGNVNITGSYYSSSDKKLKQNIKPMQSMVDKLMQLAPSTYEYRTKEYTMNLPGGRQFGLIAQDVQKVFPELVAEQAKPVGKNEKGEVISEAVNYLGINYQGFISILIKGVQEQQQKIQSLESENNQLKKDLALIKSKLGL